MISGSKSLALNSKKKFNVCVFVHDKIPFIQHEETAANDSIQKRIGPRSSTLYAWKTSYDQIWKNCTRMYST